MAAIVMAVCGDRWPNGAHLVGHGRKRQERPRKRPRACWRRASARQTHCSCCAILGVNGCTMGF